MAPGASDSFSELDITFKAGADLSVNQFFCVKHDSSDQQVILTAGDTEQTIGFLQNKPAAAGQPAAVRTVNGMVTKAVASAAIAAGVPVAADATGKIKTAASGDRVVGTSMQAAGADLEVIEVLIGIGRDAVLP